MSIRVLKKPHDKVCSGVCAGIAEFYGWQPRQVRTVFILLALGGGSSMIAYAILYFLMPPLD